VSETKRLERTTQACFRDLQEQATAKGCKGPRGGSPLLLVMQSAGPHMAYQSAYGNNVGQLAAFLREFASIVDPSRKREPLQVRVDMALQLLRTVTDETAKQVCLNVATLLEQGALPAADESVIVPSPVLDTPSEQP
jgi:hypothetical protein